MNANPSQTRVAIIGAGFSGIAAAVALTRQGITDFVMFEESEGIGGTWWKNRYPGAEVDLESHIYSFSYERNDWTRVYAHWFQLQEYLERVARKWGLFEKVRFSTKVVSAEWSSVDQTYTVVTSTNSEPEKFNAVISAVGFLNIPLIPPFARGEVSYQGDLCHTSNWPDGLSMVGKSVAVLGTGSSAVQVVEVAEKEASKLTIFQMEPNWILPKESREFTDSERRMNRLAPVYFWKRLKLYLGYDLRQRNSQHARLDGRVNIKRQAAALENLKSSLADRPDLIPVLTPEFPVEGRRTVISDTYYECLKSPKVTLIPSAVKELTQKGVIDANGNSYDFDMVVLATGFDAANYLSTFTIKGENGKELHEFWEGEPEAFLGLMVPGFPNFFMMYGPNTNAVPLVSFYEAQGAFIAKVLKRARSKKLSTVKVKIDAHNKFNAGLQQQLSLTVWAQTKSYFKSGTGKVVTQWPFSASRYILSTKVAPYTSVDYGGTET
jgi:cation diffusion facilitator CzcD-associated flavoprotein CzcO